MSDAVKEGTISLASETMLADLTQCLIDELKAAPDVWQKLSEDAQDDVIKRVASQVGDAVIKAVNLIAADSREVITAELEQITAKEGIKAVLTLAKHDPNRHALLDSVGKAVLIVVADAKQFMGGAIPKPDPDQGDLPIADQCPATA